MVGSFPFSVAIGVILGFLSGLGTGGGSLLILWLTMVMTMDPLTARSINLLFYIPSALAALWIRQKNERFPFRKMLPAIVPGCIAAGLFSVLSNYMDIVLLKKIFGIILLLVGTKEILYRPRKAR